MFQPILLIEDVHLQNVVLTVPASFKMTQKHAIEEAAAIAGFKQIQLVEESFARKQIIK
jgi:molecular chaperone DnaK (HSP70)